MSQLFYTILLVVPVLARSPNDFDEALRLNDIKCSQNSLVSCAYPSSVKKITFATRKEDLDALCPHLHTGLRCIDNYTRTCLHPDQRSHFNKLYGGTSMVIQQICKPGHHQEEFLRHAPCMNKVTSDYEVCASRYQEQLHDLTLNEPVEGVQKICGNLNDYLECSKNIVRKTCGEETATFAAGFLDEMSRSLLKSHCMKEDVVKDTNGSTQNVVSFVTITSAAVLMYILF